jgi:tRNA-dihydrouridine synthase A
LGGNDPEKMAAGAKVVEEFGFDEVNINCGCPSTKVKKGCFGALLMLDPMKVATLAKTMQAGV